MYIVAWTNLIINLDTFFFYLQTMPVLNKFESQSFCAGCGIRILDRYYLLAVDKQWHVSCLKCTDCKIQLDSELTCFARGGNIFCKDDYYRWVLCHCDYILFICLSNFSLRGILGFRNLRNKVSLFIVNISYADQITRFGALWVF